MFVTRVVATLACGACLSLAPSVAGAATSRRVDVQQGATFVLVGDGRSAVEKTAVALKHFHLAQHGNSVTIPVVWRQASSSDDVVRPDGETPSDARLVSAIRAARGVGLQVVLRPVVNVKDGSWRGFIRPGRPARWFAHYRRFVLHYLRLASGQRVAGFVIGSELSALSRREREWRRLADEVHQRFDGWVSYQANWDEAQHVRWWDALDAISLSAYFPLVATGRAPSLAKLMAGWHAYRDDKGVVHHWLREVRGLHTRFDRPVLFGEIGYRSTPGATFAPYDADPAPYDPRAQAVAYEAAMRTWWPQRWFVGMHWWFIAAEPPKASVAAHQPGRQALAVMSRWYGAGAHARPTPLRPVRAHSSAPPTSRRFVRLVGVLGIGLLVVLGSLALRGTRDTRPRKVR